MAECREYLKKYGVRHSIPQPKSRGGSQGAGAKLEPGAGPGAAARGDASSASRQAPAPAAEPKAKEVGTGGLCPFELLA